MNNIIQPTDGGYLVETGQVGVGCVCEASHLGAGCLVDDVQAGADCVIGGGDRVDKVFDLTPPNVWNSHTRMEYLRRVLENPRNLNDNTVRLNLGKHI
jgi:hypothetical protein